MSASKILRQCALIRIVDFRCAKGRNNNRCKCIRYELVLWETPPLSSSENRVLFVYPADAEESREIGRARSRSILLHALQSSTSNKDCHPWLRWRTQLFSQSGHTGSVLQARWLQHHHSGLQSGGEGAMFEPNGMGTAFRRPMHCSAGEIYLATSERRPTGWYALHWIQRWSAHCWFGGEPLYAGGREVGPNHRARSDDFLLFDHQHYPRLGQIRCAFRRCYSHGSWNSGTMDP